MPRLSLFSPQPEINRYADKPCQESYEKQKGSFVSDRSFGEDSQSDKLGENCHGSTECFLDNVHKFFCLARFEYVNPIAGLVMLVAGLFTLTFGYVFYALPLIIVGVFLVLFYRKYLLELMSV